MRMFFTALVALACVMGANGPTAAQTPLGRALKDIEVAPHWIYDDLPAAVAQARAEGKPLLVVLRCVPCPPGRSLDEKVMRPTGELAELERQFVCVRLIQANSLDLLRFQYDYDMSWAAMFLHADGTIYGRYGTRNASQAGSDDYLSEAGFRRAAERALELHRQYPANQAQLAGKLGQPPPYRRPREIPGLQDRPAVATERNNCIHCHMIREFALRAKWEEGRLSPADLWVYPLPERIGLTMDVNDGLRVQAVAPDSPAAQAGLAVGDALVKLDGQPLISIADIQWVLHHAPNEAALSVAVQRDGQTLEKKIFLTGDWKRGDIAWRASSWYGLRQGVKFDPAPESEKAAHGIAPDQLALVVKGLYGRGGPKVQAAGLRMNDVIVAVDGKTQAMNESDFLAYLRLTHGPEDSVKLTVLRGDNRRELTIPMW